MCPHTLTKELNGNWHWRLMTLPQLYLHCLHCHLQPRQRPPHYPQGLLPQGSSQARCLQPRPVPLPLYPSPLTPCMQHQRQLSQRLRLCLHFHALAPRRPHALHALTLNPHRLHHPLLCRPGPHLAPCQPRDLRLRPPHCPCLFCCAPSPKSAGRIRAPVLHFTHQWRGRGGRTSGEGGEGK